LDHRGVVGKENVSWWNILVFFGYDGYGVYQEGLCRNS